MRLFSCTADYAIRALIWLSREAGHPQTAREVALGTGIPPHYVTKVLQILGRVGLVSAHRGVGGGFWIGPAALDISVCELVKMVDPLMATTTTSGLSNPESHPEAEAVEAILRRLRGRMEALLASIRLSDLIDDTAPGPGAEGANPGPAKAIWGTGLKSRR